MCISHDDVEKACSYCQKEVGGRFESRSLLAERNFKATLPERRKMYMLCSLISNILLLVVTKIINFPDVHAAVIYDTLHVENIVTEELVLRKNVYLSVARANL